MLSVKRRKTFAILAILLVCTIAAAILECQVHAASSEDEHVAPIGHHHHSSTGTTRHVACLLAVLPTEVFFVLFAFFWFYVSRWFVCLTPRVLPPFIPPKTAAHALPCTTCRPACCLTVRRAASRKHMRFMRFYTTS